MQYYLCLHVLEVSTSILISSIRFNVPSFAAVAGCSVHIVGARCLLKARKFICVSASAYCTCSYTDKQMIRKSILTKLLH